RPLPHLGRRESSGPTPTRCCGARTRHRRGKMIQPEHGLPRATSSTSLWPSQPAMGTHLTIVCAALAVARHIENATGWGTWRFILTELPHDQVTVGVSGREAHGGVHDRLIFDGRQSAQAGLSMAAVISPLDPGNNRYP